MAYNPRKHHRRSIRLPGYDYSSPGAYFVTICVRGGECLLGDVVDGEMQFNDWGQIADEFWAQMMGHFANVSIDTFQIMPNHVHAIIVIGPAAAAARDGRKGEETSPLQAGKGGDDDCRGAISAPMGDAASTLPVTAGDGRKGEVTSPLQDVGGGDDDCMGAETAPIGDAASTLPVTARDDRKGEETSPLQAGKGEDDDCRGVVSAPMGDAVSTLPITARDGQRGEVPSPLQDVGGGDDDVSADESQMERPTLGQIVGYYKYETAKRINLLRGMPGVPFWQRNYWDHIIRNEASWNRIQAYIKNNPDQWADDQLHPGAPPNRFNQWEL